MTSEHGAIANRPEHNRYEIVIGDQVAFLDYKLRDDRVVLVHTEVPVSLRDRGLGTRLAKHALDEARGAGVEVIVQCPFITDWLHQHHEYDDIIVARVHEDGTVTRQRPDGPR